LVGRATAHEHRVDALVEATEIHLRQAEAALSHSLDDTGTCVDDLQRVLRRQVQHSRADAAAAKELSAEAHEQYLAAAGFLDHLDRNPRADREPGALDSTSNGVLVADDYKELRESIAALLRHAGFVVRTASNGLEALLGAYEMRPAVILMDVSMPVLDGLEATRLIKASAATRHVRIIAYTGSAVADDAPVRRLFAAVLQKPTAPADVVAIVQQIASL
jgi:CheY-like chemotaxis protein